MKALELPPEKLRWNCDQHIFDEFDESLFNENHLIIGQDRALKAFRLGLDMTSPGYNIFVSGYPGTGRKTAVKAFHDLKKGTGQTPNDICYVHNFKNFNNPKAIVLPPGEGIKFKNDIDEFISFLKKQVLPILNSDFYRERLQRLRAIYEKKKQTVIKPFERKIKQYNLSLKIHEITDYSQIELRPTVNRTPVSREKSEPKFDEGPFIIDTIEALKQKHRELVPEFQAILEKIRANEKELQQQIMALDRELLSPKLDERLSEIKRKYTSKAIQQFLDELKQNFLERIEYFKEKVDLGLNTSALRARQPDPFWEYQVNLLVDNSQQKGVPIIWEESPSCEQLFGTIERVSNHARNTQTDFTKIHAGSLLKANGGYLVISLSSDYDVTSMWYKLKQCLKTNKLTFNANKSYSITAPLVLNPEPIEINLKIILIGDDDQYYSLSDYDNEFDKLFKVRADFDTVTPKNKFVILQFAAFIKNICKSENLLAFSNSGLAAIVEHAVRMAGHQKKITTELSTIADLVREANYWAETDQSSEITEEHVEIAIEEQISRVNLIEQRVHEKYVEGSTLIDINGKKIGQINGLTIVELGDYSFGKPVRVTAKSSMGRSGIINIERESDFSGRSHTKGISILSGYFKGLYAQNKPINMTASICFEQSYSRIDGDSASAAEIFALISSLGNIPVRQDIAVTASMNQNGEIQPIGGVNNKIEGFYDVCKKIGLTETQGIIIPSRNVIDLQLRKDIVEAVRKGEFHIYAIETVDEGLEILTGMEVGQRDQNREFPKDSIHYLVDQRLKEMNKKDKEEDS